MTSYTDKHLAKAKDVLPRLFSDENVATNHDGDAAYVGDRCLAVLAEALANAEREAFQRAAAKASQWADNLAAFYHPQPEKIMRGFAASLLREELEGH